MPACSRNSQVTGRFFSNYYAQRRHSKMTFNIPSGSNYLGPFCTVPGAVVLELDRIKGLLEVEAASQLPHLDPDLLSAS